MIEPLLIILCRFSIDLDDLFAQRWQLAIEAKVGGQDYGDISLDDIGFQDQCVIADDQKLPQGTTPAPTPSPCADDEYVCDDRSCISANLR